MAYMKKKPSCYIETSIISYLAARPSQNLLTAACQQVTEQWWEVSRRLFDIFTSELVASESRRGDKITAQKRLDLLRDIPELRITEEAKNLARSLIKNGVLPSSAGADALHIAVATVHKIEYLLTWNCRHIDNPTTKPIVRDICISEGYICPEICTPLEILEFGGYEK
jgi:predicted nucleic acid-binding protein